jgi:ArsR family transcriptional regulator
MVDKRAAGALPPRVVRAAAEMLRTLGHPARLRIVELLTGRTMTVGELTEAMKMPQHAVSGHLRELRAAGVVAGDRRGRHVWYRLRSADAAGVVQVIRQHHYRATTYQGGEAI